MTEDSKFTPRQIQSNFNRLRPRRSWSFRDIDRREMNAHTHGYHRYPAKFVPQLVQRLIGRYAPKGAELVCDPFGGCGTTLVEAKISGRKSLGFDINPIAKLITQVKTTPINPKTLYKYREEFLKNYYTAGRKKIPYHPRIDYWFKPGTKKALDRIYFSIRKIKNRKVKKFFLCAFSHNLKNCSKWLMTSIKPQIDPEKKIPNARQSFLSHLDSMIRKNRDFYSELKASRKTHTEAKMYRRDSTQTLPVRTNSVGLIITSPPYVTSYEYADLHQLSLLWFGSDSKQFKRWQKFSYEFNDFRKMFIGTSIKKIKKKDFNSSIAENIVSALEKEDKRLAVDVANYFSDMRKAFSEMYRILKVGGKACVIIGNTNLKGVEILNAEAAAEQMMKLGFKKIDFIKREIINKQITPWRDSKTGKFTNNRNPNRKRVYDSEFIIVMEK